MMRMGPKRRSSQMKLKLTKYVRQAIAARMIMAKSTNPVRMFAKLVEIIKV